MCSTITILAPLHYSRWSASIKPPCTSNLSLRHPFTKIQLRCSWRLSKSWRSCGWSYMERWGPLMATKKYSSHADVLYIGETLTQACPSKSMALPQDNTIRYIREVVLIINDWTDRACRKGGEAVRIRTCCPRRPLHISISFTDVKSGRQKECNLGLVRQALDHAPRWTMRKLTSTYVTLSLAEIGKVAGIENEESVREIVLNMVRRVFPTWCAITMTFVFLYSCIHKIGGFCICSPGFW